MESKTCVKFAHIIVFFLLATSFETLMAQKESDELQIIKLLEEKSVDESKSNVKCNGKQKWPELNGVLVEIIKLIIVRENPLITDMPIRLNGSPPPTDFSCSRVVLFLDVMDYVVQIPVVG